jgi:hypothetical protein
MGLRKLPAGRAALRGTRQVGYYPRLALQYPKQTPGEPTPRHEPPPELPCNRPLPLAYCSPELTLTCTVPAAEVKAAATSVDGAVANLEAEA